MIRSADRVDLDVPTVKSFNRSHAVLKYRPNGQAQGDGMTPGTLAPWHPGDKPPPPALPCTNSKRRRSPLLKNQVISHMTCRGKSTPS